jgi:hypothetical protein
MTTIIAEKNEQAKLHGGGGEEGVHCTIQREYANAYFTEDNPQIYAFLKVPANCSYGKLYVSNVDNFGLSYVSCFL